jgi:hypothetical protein
MAAIGGSSRLMGSHRRAGLFHKVFGSGAALDPRAADRHSTETAASVAASLPSHTRRATAFLRNEGLS